MSRISLVSLLISLASMVAVVASVMENRRAFDRLDAFERDAPSGGTPSAVVGSTGDTGKELAALRAEIVSLREELKSLQGGVPRATIDESLVSKAMDDVIKNRRREATEKHAAEAAVKLNKEGADWLGVVAQKLALRSDQLQKLSEILNRQVIEGVNLTIHAGGESEEKLRALSQATEAEMLAVMTEPQKEEFLKMDSYWHKGKLGPRSR